MSIYQPNTDGIRSKPVYEYLIYQRNTGKIVHRHRQDAEIDLGNRKERDRLFKFVSPSLRSDDLEVLAIGENEMKYDKQYRINPETHQLEEIK